MTVSRGRVVEKEYWDIVYAPNRARSEADFAEEFRHHFDEAVRMRLVSEVPLGAFLSGGVDSSAVVASMATASVISVNTFTIGFGGDTGGFEDERQYARMVATRYRTNHHEYQVLPQVGDLVASIVRSFDEPFADDSTIPSYFVCQMARRKVTVALSGLGGDEAFCGYERYLGFALGQSYGRLPRALRSSVVAPLVDWLPEPSGGGSRVNHLKRFTRSMAEDEGRRYLGYVMKIGPQYRDRLLQGAAAPAADAAAARFVRHYHTAKAEEPLDRVFYCDVKTYLPDDILALTDRLSMCHSLEIRVPFLDHVLFEFTATIPAEMKLKWFRKKYLLKKALRSRLPQAVLTHRKQGFVGPMPRWLRGDLKQYALDVLAPGRLATHGILNAETVSRVLHDHFEGRETNDTLIWALIVFQTWFDLYIEKSVGEPMTAGRVR